MLLVHSVGGRVERQPVVVVGRRRVKVQFHPILYRLCSLSIPLYYAYKIPLLGNLLRFLLPASRQRDPMERVLDTFDEYSPRYASRHAFPEVYRWFLEAGLRDIYIADPPVHAVARRPLPDGDDDTLWRVALQTTKASSASGVRSNAEEQ